MITSEAVEACLRLLGRDGVTRRKIYINAKLGLKSSLLSLAALPMLKGTVGKYQEEKMLGHGSKDWR